VLAGPVAAVPQNADLVIGALPLDLSSLKQGIQSFFQQLENLGGEMSSPSTSAGLTPWYVAIGVATVMVEVVRRKLHKQSGRETIFQAGWQDPTSSWLPDPDAHPNQR
jgi:hypothetical protein